MSGSAAIPNDSARLQRLGQLTLRSLTFDPTEWLKELSALLAPLQSSGAPMTKPTVTRVNAGPSTAGVWFLRGASGEAWVLKQVSAKRIRAGLPSDLERCDNLLGRFPGLSTDSSLAFPLGTVLLETPDRRPVGDLLVSRLSPGEQLGLSAARLRNGDVADQMKLQVLCENVGALLADFHSRYADPVTGEATHHTDFHPTNVLYDESTDSLTMIDVTGMGTWGCHDDVEKFARIMRQIAGDRYSKAFSDRYASLVRLNLSSDGRSGSDSSICSRPLYDADLSRGISGELHVQGFKHLSRMVVPNVSTFDPCQHMVSLSWILSPQEELRHPAISSRHNPPCSEHGEWILNGGEGKNRYSLTQASDDCGYAARCEAILSKFPTLLSDERAEFPYAVVPLCEAGSSHCSSLFVAKALKGIPLAEAKLTPGQWEKVCADAGKLLADFHERYKDPQSGELTRHGDFRPNSLLYDTETGSLAMTQLWYIGTEGAVEDDLEQFTRPLRALHGEEHASIFVRSYNKRSASFRKTKMDFGSPGSPPRRKSHWLCIAGVSIDDDRSDSGSESNSDSEEEDDEDEELENHENCSVM